MSRHLPVLGLPFRRYPTGLKRQHYEDERDVCRDCLSGACCESEDPIYLTSFDVLRLSAFFNMGPADFLRTFSQERFEDARDDDRREFIGDPNCSIVTYLRRRENFSASPCIFLKYVREADGTPRRICSVYDARPLACREFYFDTCKKRLSGELAALLAEGYELVREGVVSEERVTDEIESLRGGDDREAALSSEMRQRFWVEMKRALNCEQANEEGSNSYDIAAYQDPIDEKLNRLLSKKHLRFEERYGPKPRDSQLAAYRAGLSFAGSAEHKRIMTVARAAPSTGLYALRTSELRVGVRTLMPGAEHATLFATIPDEECEAFIAGIPPVKLFPEHEDAEVRALTLADVYRAVLKGLNHLIRFASYHSLIGDVIEDTEPGEVESEMLQMIAGFETSLNPFVARNPYFEPVKQQAAEATLAMLEKRLSAPFADVEVFGISKLLTRTRSATATLGPNLRRRFALIKQAVDDALQKSRLEHYVALSNPIETRRLGGKRLNSSKAWKALRKQALDIRYAAEAGFEEIDLDAFFVESVDWLELLEFRESYAEELWDVVAALAESMSFHQTIECKTTGNSGAGDRLAAYAVRLSNYLDENFYLNREILCSILLAYKSLGVSCNESPLFGVITQRIIASQQRDGSWDTDPLPADRPEYQEDYLRTMYRATWQCLDALRPMRNDSARASLGTSQNF